MHKDTFHKLLVKTKFSAKDMELLEQLIEDYPWFTIPRFLKLKANFQLNNKFEADELNKVAVFSSDRKFLYKWTKDEVEENSESSFMLKSELEFIDNGEILENKPDAENASFELLDEFDEVDDADVKAISEKEEADMEIDEIDEDVPLPVIDSLEEEEDSEAPEADELTAESEEILSYSVDSKKEDAVTTEKPDDSENRSNQSVEMIEHFLRQDPGIIKADKETSLEGDVSMASVIENDSYLTDTLAKIYLKQGLHAKAIYAYERLSLKYPEKSAYFAAQIEKIKNNSNV